MLAYVISFWFFLTPIVYPLSMIPPHLRFVALLNPMTGLVEAFRWSMLGIGFPNWTAVAMSGGIIAAVLTSGLWYFAASESGTVDRL